MLNKIILIGNLTRDVELRYTPSGSAIAKFGLAVNRAWKDRNSGEKREEVCYIDINIFGRSAEVANQHLSKGKRILVEGRLQFDQWQDQEGQKRSKHSISAESFQFLDTKGDNQGGGYNNNQQRDSQSQDDGHSHDDESNRQNNNNQSSQASIEIDDDDIPF